MAKREVVSVCEAIEEWVAREKGHALSPKRRAYLRRRARLAGPWRLMPMIRALAAAQPKQVRR